MDRRTWGIVVAVVVLAAAGATTALLVSGDGDGDYKSLPKCGKLAAALPGKPALAASRNVTEPQNFQGLHEGWTDIDCVSDSARADVEVELYQQGDMDLFKLGPYPDRATHDGRWRANDVFAKRTEGFETLNSTVMYGPREYSLGRCTVIEVKNNAIVMLTIPNALGAHTTDVWKAGCRQIAVSQMPKVVDAALG